MTSKFSRKSSFLDGNAAVFMVGGGNRETVPESMAGTHVQVASMSWLFCKESTATDPEFC
jgi:hypothetical protein